MLRTLFAIISAVFVVLAPPPPLTPFYVTDVGGGASHLCAPALFATSLILEIHRFVPWIS
jgi:hypothetical protein